jgi:hypothetical protein
MPTNLISKDKIRQLADKAAGLQMPDVNPRLKTVMARLLNDLFVNPPGGAAGRPVRDGKKGRLRRHCHAPSR